MKTKTKAVKLSTKRAVTASTHAGVPLKERRLNYGNKWDFAPAPEDSKNYVIAPQHELFINGKFVKPASGIYFESINPATEQTLTTIAAANTEDVDLAVKSARSSSVQAGRPSSATAAVRSGNRPANAHAVAAPVWNP